MNTHGWQRDLVVRTSASGWQTFPDLCWQVTALWLKCSLWVNQQANSAFRLFGVDKWV